MIRECDSLCAIPTQKNLEVPRICSEDSKKPPVYSYLLSRKLTKFEISSDIQAILFEVNMRKTKWFFLCIYNPPSMNGQCFLDSLSNIIDYYSNVYGNHIVIGVRSLYLIVIAIVIGDLTFMETNNYFNFIKNNTCFQGPGSYPILLIIILMSTAII